MTDTEYEHEPITAIDVRVVDDVREKHYSANFGSFNNFAITIGPIRILPRRKERDRAVVWISSTPDAATSVLLASSSENAQAGVGGILTIAGQQLVIESQQDVWAIKIGAGADITLSVHDETWQTS